VLLLPDAQLINVAILSQVLNGVLLPVVIILMLMLINRKDLMGEHRNSTGVECDCVGHEHDRDRDDAGDAVGFDAGTLRTARLAGSGVGEDAILVDYQDYH
jgi:hypothetical protein